LISGASRRIEPTNPLRKLAINGWFAGEVVGGKRKVR